MTEERPSIAVVLRYSLFQLPGIALLGALLLLLLRIWPGFPPWAAWTVFLLWIIKDVFLFPFLWRSYSTSRLSLRNTMIGQTGTVRETLDPTGRILVRGEIWRAELATGCAPAAPGSPVQVRDLRGLILVVEHGEAGHAGSGKPSRGVTDGDEGNLPPHS